MRLEAAEGGDGPAGALSGAARGRSGAAAAPGLPVNAMTVDVEDYFQVSAFAGSIDRADWDAFPCRVERNTDRVLGIFADAGVRATFFTLGWVAERYPELVRRIVEGGHELASHGYAHHRVTDQTPAQFAADVGRTRALLEDIGGVPVIGYRAASFSIDATTPWAHRVLAEAGYRYSSSVYPVRHDHYGMPDAPRFAYQPADGQGIREIPITTVALGGRNLPCGGGGYFRLLPFPLFRWSIGRVNRREGESAIFYFHPWEVDPDQPRQKDLGVKTRFRHYVNLARMESRLCRLLTTFRWDRMDRVFSIA
jgi:polysaccharide deacetylase family protein (PEP-CTERM system associated)